MKVRCLKSGEGFQLDDSLILKSGGEGTVYQVPGDNKRLIKRYHTRIDDKHIEKLETMLAYPPVDHMRSKGHASIAWPEDLVISLDEDRVIGFVMPRLQDGHPISVLYYLDQRRRLFPEFTYGSLCRIARNLSSAVWAIHEAGYVIGDVKDANMLVTDKALVTLVDTDSFQITHPETKEVYQCPVTTMGFTAPELLGNHRVRREISPAQDLFGIGILLFQLLMEGPPPYACAFPNEADPPDYNECLRRGYFPYGSQAIHLPPPGAPPFAMLPPAVQDLFIRCFVNGHTDPVQRPDAGTWHRILKRSESTLTRCEASARHVYFGHFDRCPWCERTQRLNDFDPFATPQWTTQSSSPGTRQSPQPSQSSAPRRATPPPRHSSVPSPPVNPPAPSIFTASTTSITPGQPITFNWTIPHASSVQLIDQSGRTWSTSNSPHGQATVYPAGNTTYQLSVSSLNVRLPKPIVVSVNLPPVPVILTDITIELKEPIPLGARQLALRRNFSLREMSLRLVAPLALRGHQVLSKYGPLNGITVDLHNASLEI
jgi:DNA-binding helix-hairpin-helix protein with protein kinase domain